MYFIKLLPTYPKVIHHMLNKWSPTKKLTFLALMAALSAVLQSAGGFLPGIGYIISPFATAPILLGTLISLRSGVLTYISSSGILLMIQPSELLIFPFTTGLLGIGLGWSFYVFKKRLGILLSNSIILFLGICIPLYVLHFPVFGPTVSTSINTTTFLLFGFSFLYSWLWLELGLLLLRKIKVLVVYNA